MTEAQTVFTILYGFYFTAIVMLTGKFQPFDTPSMYKWKRHAWIRFVFSFIFLNILPLFYFVLVLNWLSGPTKFQFDLSV